MCLQAVLCWHRAGRLAASAELVCSQSRSCRGNVAGISRRRGLKPRYAQQPLQTTKNNPKYFLQHLFVTSFPWTVDHELNFQDKYLFYRFLDDEEEDAVLPSDDEKREAEEELQETLLFLSQIGPDAHVRMILRKPWVSPVVLLLLDV